MMPLYRLCATLLLVALMCGNLDARGPRWHLFRSSGFDTNGCPIPCGCNDYLRKPSPPIVCPAGCPGPNDYLRKPCPIVPGVPRCGGPDDYCHKPAPMICCPR